MDLGAEPCQPRPPVPGPRPQFLSKHFDGLRMRAFVRMSQFTDANETVPLVKRDRFRIRWFEIDLRKNAGPSPTRECRHIVVQR